MALQIKGGAGEGDCFADHGMSSSVGSSGKGKVSHSSRRNRRLMVWAPSSAERLPSGGRARSGRSAAASWRGLQGCVCDLDDGFSAAKHGRHVVVFVPVLAGPCRAVAIVEIDHMRRVGLDLFQSKRQHLLALCLCADQGGGGVYSGASVVELFRCRAHSFTAFRAARASASSCASASRSRRSAMASCSVAP